MDSENPEEGLDLEYEMCTSNFVLNIEGDHKRYR